MIQWQGHEKGINLGGWFSQCDHTEERYDHFIRPEDFGVIRSWGADHVRVPIDYELLEEQDGTPKEEGYERLRRVIGLCRQNGLNMILDLHKTAGFSFDANEHETGFFENPAYQERFYRLWERIARHFGRDADMLAFELLNEVTEKDYCQTWNRIAAACIARIRAIAPATTILVGGYWHNSAAAVKDIEVPDDRHLVLNFHCYEPIIFTHQGAYWMETMEPDFRLSMTASCGEMYEAARRMCLTSNAGLDRHPADGHLSAEYFIALLAEAASAAKEKGLPLYCGEYGVIDLSTPEDTLAWYRMIHEAFVHYGIGRAAWSYRQMDFGLSDERMDGVRPELLKVL